MNLDDDDIFLSKLNALKASLGAAAAGIKFHVYTATLDTALTDADTSQDLDIATDDAGAAFPANARPITGYVYQLTAVDGCTTLTVALGDVGNPDELFEETDLVAQAALDWIDAPGAYTPWTLEAAYAPIAQYVSTGTNVNAATGRVRHVIVYWQLTKPNEYA